MLKQEIREKITKNSVSLERYGLNELAWSKEDAQNLILAIMNDYIGILGGDVYILNQDCLEPLSDNWCCEPINIETEGYYTRSKNESLNYIKNYPVGNNENIIFSITFTEKL